MNFHLAMASNPVCILQNMGLLSNGIDLGQYNKLKNMLPSNKVDSLNTPLFPFLCFKHLFNTLILSNDLTCLTSFAETRLDLLDSYHSNVGLVYHLEVETLEFLQSGSLYQNKKSFA